MKKFLKIVIAYFLVTAMLCFIPAIIVDAFSVFHPMHVRNNGVEPNKNYIKMHNILQEPDRFDGFMLGSSHVAMLDVEKLPGKTYNLYYSGGVPEEQLANVKTMVKNGIVPQRLYLGIDNISLTATYDEHTQEQLRAPYEYSVEHPLEFWMLYLDPVVNLVRAVKSIRSSGNDIFSEMPESFYSNGGAVLYGIDSEIDPDEAAVLVHKTYADMIGWLQENSAYPETSRNMNRVIDAVSELKQLCDENGIELTVFITPMYFEQFKQTVTGDTFLSLMRRLAAVTPYYSFCGYNKFTTDVNYYYFDHQHYLAEMGDLMIDAFANGKVDPEAYSQGFGVYVTEDNIEELISLITDPTAKW